MVHFSNPATERDNAAVVEFLTLLAGSANHQGIIPQRAVEDLRLELGLFAKDPSAKAGVFEHLLRDHSEFIQVLSARYGDTRLMSNLLRFTTRVPLQQLVDQLNQWGASLVHSSKMVFNRPFELYEGGQLQGRILFSTVLLDQSEAASRVVELLCTARRSLNAMRPQKSVALATQDLVDDDAHARALRFDHGVASSEGLLQSDAFALSQIAFALKTLVMSIETIGKPLSLGDAKELMTLQVLCNRVRSEADRLQDIGPIPSGAGLRVAEAHRQALVQTLFGINQIIAEIIQIFSDENLFVDRRPLAQERRMVSTLQEARRSIACDLIGCGHAPSRAYQAADALTDYCQTNNVMPSELISSELKKIHLILTDQSLAILCQVVTDQALIVGTAGKSANLDRSNRLLAFFTEQASGLGATFLLCLTMLGCGVKKMPVSNIPDERPAIPRLETISFSPPELTPAVDSDSTDVKEPNHNEH